MDQKSEKPAAWLHTLTGSETSSSLAASEAFDSATHAGKRQAKQTPQSRWADAHPLARWAHRSFEAALRKGLVTRQPCAMCGAEPADFHHDPNSYDQPLLGVFLCRRHHIAEHRRLRCEDAS